MAMLLLEGTVAPLPKGVAETMPEWMAVPLPKDVAVPCHFLEEVIVQLLEERHTHLLDSGASIALLAVVRHDVPRRAASISSRSGAAIS